MSDISRQPRKRRKTPPPGPPVRPAGRAPGGRASTFEAVAGGLQDQAAQVRRSAASALARLAPELAVRLLGQALGDPDAAVRNAAAEALGTMGESGVQPALRALEQPAQGDGALQALSRLSLREGETQVP